MNPDRDPGGSLFPEEEDDVQASTTSSQRTMATRKSKGGAAEQMAKRQREISVSEFFTKNRHLLGFDSPRKALLTAIKEAVDNSLDACEEARILPELQVEIRRGKRENYFTMIVEDNGPGIVRATGAEHLRQAALRIEVPPRCGKAVGSRASASPRRACTANSRPATRCACVSAYRPARHPARVPGPDRHLASNKPDLRGQGKLDDWDRCRARNPRRDRHGGRVPARPAQH